MMYKGRKFISLRIINLG